MKNILVPTDLSIYVHDALKYAVNMAAKSNAHLFFLLDDRSNKHECKQKAISVVKSIFTELGLNFENACVEFIIENIALSNKLIEDTIIKYNIDLTIIGSSHDSTKTTFYGGHISKLISEVCCPVLTIPHGYANIKIERIAYATELHDLTKRIKMIIPFARSFDASIETFHVHPVYPMVVDPEKYDIKKKLARLREKTGYEKINMHFIETHFANEPVTGIREFVKEYQPDMLVMFHKPRGLFDKLFFDSGATPAFAKITPVPLLAINKKTAFKIM